MKTKITSLLTSTLILSCFFANAEQGKPLTYIAPMLKTQKVIDGDTGRKTFEPFNPFQPESDLNSAEGQAYGSPFMEDVRVYNVSGEKSLAMGYISGQAAKEIGYMGFKVGDKVKWDCKVGNAYHDKRIHTDFTGTIDLLDSNKCYIKVDNCNKVAVKPYEDITKIGR